MVRATTDAIRVVSFILLGLAGVGAIARTQTFSADVVTTRAGTRPGRLGHVYVSGSQVRIEAAELTDGFFIVDSNANGAWFVRPGERLFMEAKRSSPLTQLFVPVDPGDPCRQWQVMEQVAGGTDGGGQWRCEEIGRDVVDGRETMKYLTVSSQSRRSYRWVDPQRAFPIRVETEDGTIVALQNIVDAPQPAGLFAIPSDYHKFDPGQLIEVVKRSDVWVESPP